MKFYILWFDIPGVPGTRVPIRVELETKHFPEDILKEAADHFAEKLGLDYSHAEVDPAQPE